MDMSITAPHQALFGDRATCSLATDGKWEEGHLVKVCKHEG